MSWGDESFLLNMFEGPQIWLVRWWLVVGREPTMEQFHVSLLAPES